MSKYGERLTKAEVKSELGSEVQVKKAENNTFEITYPNGNKAIRYHHTDIMVTLPNGDIILNTDGWLTSTTKERLNNHLPAIWRISQINKIWYLANNSHSYPFKDGMIIHSNGKVEGQGEDPKKLLRLDKDIKKYIEGFIKALFEKKIPQPSAGDCWYCSLQTDKGQSMGEEFKDTDHIIFHFEEKYYVPSLLMNAIEAFPVSMAAKSSIGYYMGFHNEECAFFDDIARIQIKSSLRRYLRRQLGMAS